MEILSTYIYGKKPQSEEKDKELMQPLDRSFNWNCFGPQSEASEVDKNSKDFVEFYPDQAKADLEQHYDIDGVTIWKGEVITTSDPK